MTRFRLGLVVNPVAGLGGRVGLKGSDGSHVQERARALGAVPHAADRARTALGELRSRGAEFELLTAGGPMGPGTGRVVFAPEGSTTSATDTAAAVRALREHGIDLLLFAGGDGTARDVHDALADSSADLPVLGVPTGVKMHSAVFAVHPRAAGEVVAAYVRGAGGVRLRRAEVMDRDEAALREGRVTARLHGWLTVPYVPARVQQRKTGGTVTDPESVAGIAAELAERAAALSPTPSSTPTPTPTAGGEAEAGGRPGAPLPEHPLLILGPGTTTRALAAALGVDVTPTGVNALSLQGSSATVVAPDATADELLALAGTAPTALIAVSPIGGQGFLLGRGNQQIGPELIRAVGAERIVVVCTESKLAALRGRPLLLDSGDDTVDAALAGYRPVLTGRRTTTMYRIAT